MKSDLSPTDYAAFFTTLTTRIEAAQIGAARAINRELVLLYWDIGEAIAAQQQTRGWGDTVVEQVARDLARSYPGNRGFSSRNVWRMRQFFLDHTVREFLSQLVTEITAEDQKPEPQILSQAVAELRKTTSPARQAELARQIARELVASVPWGHHANQLAGIESPAARLYYLRATARFGWSRAVLLNQIKAQAYERAKAEKKAHNFAVALPEHFAEQATEMLKSRYNLEFLGLAGPMRERELEDRLIERLQHFILELGYGFCFVGRQYRLALGSKEYFVDLLFYHRFLKALVAFDLKIGAFEPEYSGKMDFYLNLLNDKERGPGDRPSIGVILCAEKDDVEVEFALRTKANPIGVAAYRLQPKLPAELKGKLPSARQLTAAMKGVLPG
ncbi:MAG TPA: PDDEXK nuclease domain-containing protein [Opitutaceae bacterium]